ncbi:MAG TPA: dihydropteroate synthase [Chromatiales bacterium]|nr:dihydropteroate synthase [Chromatiales bacterium]
MQLDLGGRIVDLSVPRVMGILNVTPDSFSDGGDFVSVDRALRRAEEMVDQGAAIIDIGGESSRPGARPVPEGEELRRVVPVVEALRARFDVPISVDTSKPGVMRAAVEAGAAMVNDIYALRRPGALEVAAGLGVPVCLMHMQGTPETMQHEPRYRDVLAEVYGFLEQRVRACRAAGIPQMHLLVDPGFGFGKTLDHNYTLLAGLKRFTTLGVPVLVGVSRKRMLGEVTGRGVRERLHAGVAAAAIAVHKGAHIVRTHDVGPTVDALAVVTAVRAHEHLEAVR